MSIQRPAHMLERHAADFVGEQSRLRVQWLQPCVLHLVVAEHLLDQQQRIGPYVELTAAARLRPLERSQQAAVLGDVIRRMADGFGEFLDKVAVDLFDPDAETGRPGIAPCTAVDVGHERRRCHWAGW